VNSALPGSLLSRTHNAIRRAKAYIYSRRSLEGGYCFYKSEYVDEPNLCDTYHAITALKLMGADELRTTELVRFVQQPRIFGVRYLYWYAFTLDRLGQASLIDRDRLSLIRNLSIASPPKEHSSVSEWLEDACRTVRLMRRFADVAENSRAVSFIKSLKSDGGYENSPNLMDTYVSPDHPFRARTAREYARHACLPRSKASAVVRVHLCQRLLD
jgi:hypothetical protein